MIRLKAIVPKLATPAAYRRARSQALDATAREVKEQFEQTTATWKDKPTFEVSTPSESERIIGTDDAVYGYVDDGTKPHVIVARGSVLAFGPGAAPKTKPRVIGSGAGSRGGATVFTKRVQHPGTEARDFSETIAEQAEQILATRMQRAIDGVE